jgi:purine-binding chemotaxis protein CheW
MKRPRASGQPVDWDRVKQRLAAAEEALARGFAPTDEERRRIAQARADAVAQQRLATPQPGQGIEVVEFVLAGQHYAVEAKWVREVQPLKELTPLPCTPAFVSGMIHAHGRILALIDLKTFFELPESGLTDLNKVIILQQADTEFGILAERIVGVRRLPTASIRASSFSTPDKRSRYLRGEAPGPLMVLDAGLLLSDPSIVVDEEVAP